MSDETRADSAKERSTTRRRKSLSDKQLAILDVIPMIGATLGAVIVSAIGLATDLKVGIACIIFYLIYQPLENYVIYPRVMSRSVDIPGAMTVIAALVGASLLGVIGALIAIPVVIFFLIVQGRLTSGLVSGAVKG